MQLKVANFARKKWNNAAKLIEVIFVLNFEEHDRIIMLSVCFVLLKKSILAENFYSIHLETPSFGNTMGVRKLPFLFWCQFYGPFLVFNFMFVEQAQTLVFYKILRCLFKMQSVKMSLPEFAFEVIGAALLAL